MLNAACAGPGEAEVHVARRLHWMRQGRLRLQLEQLSKDISTYKIIDVRPTVEYEKGHIKNALTFPIALTYNDL